MRIFKPTYKTNGSTRTSPRWHIRFRDHLSFRRQVVGFTDKGQSDELRRKLEKLVAAVANRERPDPELARWLEGLTPSAHFGHRAQGGPAGRSVRSFAPSPPPPAPLQPLEGRADFT